MKDKMLKSVLYTFILGAFLHETNADIDCYVKKVMNRGVTKPFWEGSESICKNVKETLIGIRDDIKVCKVPKISILGFEKLLDEFCTGDSDLTKEWESHNQCLYQEVTKLRTCIPAIPPKDTTVERMQVECTNRHIIVKCFKDLGKPCNTETLVNRFAITYDSYLQGICAQVDVETKKVETMNVEKM